MDADTQVIFSTSFPHESAQLIPKAHRSHLKAQKKCSPCFSYRLVKNSQKGALFIAIANIFYCIAVLTLSTKEL